MNHSTTFKILLLAAIAMAASPAAAETLPMYAAAFKAGKVRISAEHRAEVAACSALADVQRTACVARAKTRLRTARAELRLDYVDRPETTSRIARQTVDN